MYGFFIYFHDRHCLFADNPQKVYQNINAPMQELLIGSAYYSSQMANVIVQMVTFKIPITWLEVSSMLFIYSSLMHEQFLASLFSSFVAKPVEVISLFLYLSKGLFFIS
jgi:hypothetical protein